jgi:hypothetical protein
VNIPIVPILPKVFDGGDEFRLNRLNRSASNPPVSPHRINNFVYESSPNRLILDFGETPDPVRTFFSDLFFRAYHGDQIGRISAYLSIAFVE